MARSSILLAVALASVACNPKSLRTGYCHTNGDCASKMCNTESRLCIQLDASATDGDGGDGPETGPPKCMNKDDCADHGTNKVCDTGDGKCVECLPTDNPCTATSPICASKTCHPCADDLECDAGVCMKDGHCAGSDEIIFVEFNSNGCPGADGSTTKPYCTPNDGAAQL